MHSFQEGTGREWFLDEFKPAIRFGVPGNQNDGRTRERILDGLP